MLSATQLIRMCKKSGLERWQLEQVLELVREYKFQIGENKETINRLNTEILDLEGRISSLKTHRMFRPGSCD